MSKLHIVHREVAPFPDSILGSLDSRPGNARRRRAYLGILRGTGLRVQFRADQVKRRAEAERNCQNAAN